MRSTVPFAVVVMALSVLWAGPLRADALLGEPWEPGIVDGVARQEQERRDRRPEVILQQARLLASRRADATTRVVRLYLLARAYGIAGDAASAMSTYREVLRAAPRCYFAHHDLAMLQMGLERPDAAGAERNLRLAVGIHPRYVTGYRKLSTLLARTGRSAEAIGVLRRIVDLDPGDLQARFLFAQALLGEGRMNDAEREVAMLLRQEPNNPAFRDMKAEIWLQRGRAEDAKRVWRQIAVENPSTPKPLQGYVRCLEALRASGQQPPLEDYLWALEGLYRLERDPARKQKLKEDLERMRRRDPVPAASRPEGPPSDTDMVRILADAPAAMRAELLRYVYARPDAPERPLLLDILARVGPRKEPSPAVRSWCLRVLGRFGGVGLIGLVRHSLADPDAETRVVAVDTLVDLAQVSDAALGAAFLVLGPVARRDDVRLASAARNAAYELGKGAEAPDLETEAERRRAFAEWWSGPAAREARIQGLQRFAEVGDHFPEDVLAPYLADDDPHTVEAAWKTLSAEAARLLAQRHAPDPRTGESRPVLTGARRAWLERLPTYRENAATGKGSETMRAELGRWAQDAPR